VRHSVNDNISDVQNHEILSKTAIHVLSIIWNGPINPYAIAKLINYKRKIIRRPIHIQTIYSIVKALHRKRLIVVKRSKNGRMPDRNVYSITDKGKELLRYNLISLLSKPAEPLSEFSLGLFAVGNLDKELVLTALKKYRNEINQDIDIRNLLPFNYNKTYNRSINS
jgi:DNA-binding PadR family transcriptional regulator